MLQLYWLDSAAGAIATFICKESGESLEGDESSDLPRRPRGRVTVAAQVTLRRAGVHGFRVRVFDLSPTGCKVEFVERPLVNERLWIKFDGLESLGAIVRWVDGMVGGLEFDRPIYPAVFDNLVARLK